MNCRVLLLAILMLEGKIVLWRLLARVLHLMALALTGLLVFGEEAFQVGGPLTRAKASVFLDWDELGAERSLSRLLDHLGIVIWPELQV